MDGYSLDNEPGVRLGSFVVVFIVMAAWEVLAPRRRQTLPRTARWPHNIGIVLINTLLVRVLFPTAAVGMALYVESRGWGLLNGSTISECVDALRFAPAAQALAEEAQGMATGHLESLEGLLG